MQIDEIYGDVLKIVSRYGVDISSIDSEEFFNENISNISGSKEEAIKYIEEHMSEWFKHLSYSPRWLQNSDWQYIDGKPMVFVGQLDISASAGVFHDDSSFYIFWDSKTGITKTIIQVS